MLQLLDASISGFIDLCNAFYHKVMAEKHDASSSRYP
jgi:hypothetical protein